MDLPNAVAALSALAQHTRLKVFRLLIEQGPEGMPATAIAEKIGVRQNLMSTHLNILSNKGLTTARRDGRRVYHAIDLDHTRALFSFLVQDCCHGGPEQCASLLDEILPLARCAQGGSSTEDPRKN